MTRHLLAVISGIFYLASAIAYAQPSTSAPRMISETWDMPSAEGTYRIFVERTEKAPPNGYSVLYILDANAFMPLFRENARLLAGREMADSFLIVGVGYPTDELFDTKRRMHDDTPAWKDTSTAAVMHVPVAITGGEDKFTFFLCDTLRSEVARRYPINAKEQSIFGHSLAGLFVLELASKQPGTFSRYFAASPSLWWNDGETAEEILQRLRDISSKHAPPLISTSVGEEEQPIGGSASPLHRGREEFARMVTRNKDFAARVKEISHGASSFWIAPGNGHMGNAIFSSGYSLRSAFALHN